MTELECEKCGHKWKTKSNMFRVTCPSCLNKVKNKIWLGIE